MKWQPQRTALLIVAIIMLGMAAWVRGLANGSAATFGWAACLRIGLVLLTIWFAWDSLRKPARWIGPGLAAAVVLVLCVVAIQPKSLLVIAPMAGVLLMLGAVVRSFRR